MRTLHTVILSLGLVSAAHAEWHGPNGSFEVTCSCGTAKKNAPQGACKDPQDVPKGHMSTWISKSEDEARAWAEEKGICKTALSGICTHNHCNIETKSAKLALTYDFNGHKPGAEKTYEVEHNSTTLKVTQPGTNFRFIATLKGSAITFDVRTKDKVNGKVVRAAPKLDASKLYPLAFDYFAALGKTVDSIKGTMIEDNYFEYMLFTEGLKSDAGAEDLFKKFVKARKGTTAYWKNHLNERFGKVRSVQDRGSELDFDVALGEE